MAQFCVEPEPGGLTEIFRTDYEHWAIYMEGGDVIHLGPPTLGDTLSDSRPQPVYKSISAAKEMVGEEKKYSVLSMNCERFATELRYGAASSRQVEHAMCVVIGMLIIFIMLIILVPWLAALLAPSKKSRQNQFQPDEATGCCIRSRCGDQWRGPPTATLSAWHSHLGSM
ncbi:phospholipase A and acyltransferase 4-like isoform X1 [Equus przewalskii]|uniref:Phospholipase A and acyltransferase 4-like isoform X1 n=1 Tax=Equus przewalskii TaxID=9798 RepID=A0ABM4JZE8_EQUPR